MKSWRRRAPLGIASPAPETFLVLAHSLAVTCVAYGRWTVTVDGVPVPGTFGSQVEAWEAGVHAADTHDQLQPQRVG